MTSLLSGEVKEVSKEEEDKVLNAKTKVQTQTRVLVLKNMLNINELEIDEEYTAICEDVQLECEKFGKVFKVVIPRPGKGEHVPGLGKIFVEFEQVEFAMEARKALTKRLFDGNTVEGSYMNEETFKKGDYDVVNVAG